MNDEILKKQEKIMDIIIKEHEKKELKENINEIIGDDFENMEISMLNLKPSIQKYHLKFFKFYSEFVSWQDNLISENKTNIRILNLYTNNNDEIEVLYIENIILNK